MSKYAMDVKKLTLLAPQDIVATATRSQFFNLAKANGIVELIVPFGNIASTDSTGEVVVTVEADAVNDTSSSDTVAAAIAFDYRLSAAVGTDSLGAKTAATTAGVAVGQADDNKTLHIFVDPAAVAAAVSGAKYVRVAATPTAEVTACLLSVLGEYTPDYASASLDSAT